MPEVKKQEATKDAAVLHPRLHLFINNKLVILEGDWEWSLHAGEMFCSDVFFMLPLPASFEGTRAFIHPDDLENLKDTLSGFNPDILQYFSFRVITTYANVVVVKGEGLFKATEDEAFVQKLHIQETEQYIQQKQSALELAQQAQLLNSYRIAEQQQGTGVWYVNTNTHEVYYSDGIYEIYELFPQSLNPHLHTFNSFLHPEDVQAVTEAFDAAYAAQAPLHLEFRVITHNDKVKYLRQGIAWRHNEKGERMLYGTVADISSEKIAAAEIENLQDEVVVHKALLQNNEYFSRSANWYMHLITRKTVYTEGIFRVYGIKNTGLSLTTNTLLGLVHPDDQSIVALAHKKIFNEHLPPDIEFRIIRPDGKTRYLKQKGKLVVNAAQEFIIAGTTQDITEEVTRESRIAELKEQHTITEFAYAKTEELAGIGSWMWNTATGEIKWSTGFYSLLGYKNAHIKPSQKFLLSVVHPDDRDAFAHEVEEMLGGKKESTFSFRFVRKEGTRFMAANFKLITTDDHALFIGTLQDRTALHHIQEQLKEQVTLAELLSDASPDRMIVTDINNTIIRWNQPCEEQYGIKKDKAIGKNIFDLLPPLKRPDVLHNFHRALNGETVQLNGGKGIITKGIHNLLMQPIKDEDGQVIAVLHLIHDVTRELELQEELTHRLQFIERLLSASIDRIIVLDKNMNYQYWNKKAEDYYGIPKEAVIGRNILELFPAFVNDPSYPELRTALRGEVVHIPANADLQSKKGYYETYLLPIKDEKGEISSVLWIVHDLSKEFILQRDRKKTLETLDALNENYFELDEYFRFTYINKKALIFFEKKEEDLSGTVIWDAFPELMDSPLYFAITHTLEEQLTTSGEFFFPFKKVPVYVSIVPSIDGIIIGFFDIANIKEAERRTQESKALLQSVFEAVPNNLNVMSTVRNEDGAIIDFEYTLVNKQTENLTQRKDLIGNRIFEIYPEAKNLLFEGMVRTVETGEAYTIEFFYPHQQINTWLRNAYVKFGDGVIETSQNISQSKEAEEKLRENQKFIQQITEASPDVVTVFDLQNRESIYINHTLSDILGYSISDIKAMEYEGRKQTLIYPDDREKIIALNKEMLSAKDEEIRSLEYRLVCKDGKIKWVKNRCKVFKRAEKGEVTHLLSVIQDITEQMQTGEKLRESELFLGSVMAATVDYIMVFDLIKQKTVFVNRSAYKEDEQRYRETLDLDYAATLERAHPDDREQLHHYIQSFKTAPDNEIRSLEYRVIKDGGVIWYKSRAKVFKRDVSGQPVQYISVVQDITSEIALRHELAERIAYAENLIDSSIDRMFVIDHSLTVRAWNHQCVLQYGIQKDDALGRAMLHVFPQIEGSVEILQNFKKALAGEHVYLPAEQDLGGIGVSEKFLIPLRNEGKIYSVLVVLHDVTAAHQSREALKELNEVLAQKNKELAQKHDEIASFAFVASHDLREPLRKIHTFSDWLLEGEAKNLSVTGKTYLNRICAATRRMEMLIEDVLVLSKIHSIKNEFVPTDLNKVIENVKKDLQPEITASNAVIKYKALPTIASNASQLFYLLRNLLHNALKFQNPGNVPHIEISAIKVKGSDAGTEKADPQADYLALSVTDNGIGIDEKYFSKIFQVFQQLHGKGENIGTGMGLAICRKVMENHKGFVIVKSTLGQGSVFCCLFPTSE